MKVAICISGQMRTFRECYHQIDKYFGKFNPDVFIYTWKQNRKSIRGGRDVEENINYEELEKLYHPKAMVIEEYKDSYLYELEGVIYPESIKEQSLADKSITSIPMFYMIYKCNELRKKHYDNYDIVIRLRPDLILPDIDYEEIFKLIAKDGRNIFITDQYNSSQFSDRLFISNQEHNNYYCSLFTRLNDYWQQPIRNNVMLVGERLMKFHMDQYDKPLNIYKLDTQILR